MHQCWQRVVLTDEYKNILRCLLILPSVENTLEISELKNYLFSIQIWWDEVDDEDFLNL